MQPTTTPQTDLQPSLLDTALNQFQAWAIENPHNLVSRMFLPIISFGEGIIANNPPYLDAKRQALGSSFCCAGQVVLADFETLETALTSPQARDWRLGATMLSATHGPGVDKGQRNVFLISLSDAAAGGGNHDVFRQCVDDYFFNEQMIIRQNDQVAKQLVNKLASDYVDRLSHNALEEFFNNDQLGWKAFLVRYIHYVIFGINPNDQEKIAIITNFHYTQKGTLYYFAGSSLLKNLNLLGFGKIPELIEQVATIYENSPALANFQENNPKHGKMTRQELGKLMVSLISIAGLQGPLHLGRTAMGYQLLPAYKGHQTSKIDVKDYWDKLDLNDHPSIKLFLLECARLFTPVSASHRVATEPFTARVGGKMRTFPTGTKILIPMLLGMLSEDFWGATTYEFNPQRENLCPFHMGFNSVGDRHAGRICPGKDLALKMLTDVIITVGKARRSYLSQKT
ncbi:cytochrome 450 [Cronbergia sp. UHCC 0137]|uniref:cytochrome 450 n=1 Tax=Cronbergia sp. UHCC 0137 TaxID=3110239 RepID=UPI002B204519|nr:cytochrome 450 [Cronbergia sp. UHCC 0137]MEA5617757.1 cytochrome 450 [Cronbergia sp. UHCC 0137]